MSASLVGSEMCIRDRWNWPSSPVGTPDPPPTPAPPPLPPDGHTKRDWKTCLLYTSDAADDM
eukprot:903439-Alexandrium_andersonii.AAC.1